MKLDNRSKRLLVKRATLEERRVEWQRSGGKQGEGSGRSGGLGERRADREPVE